MNRAQKEAWLGLFLGIPLILIPSGVFILISFDKGASYSAPFILVYLASMSLLPWLFRLFACRNKKQVNYDERDRMIFLIIPWWITGSNGSVPVIALPIILVGGLSVFVFIQSLTILILYGRWRKHG